MYDQKILELSNNAVPNADVIELRTKGEERFINWGKNFGWEEGLFLWMWIYCMIQSFDKNEGENAKTVKIVGDSDEIQVWYMAFTS